MTSLKIQVVVIAEDGQQEVREIISLMRGELTPETLGLSLAEGKTILKHIQQLIIERQVGRFMASQTCCPGCGKRRRSKGQLRERVREQSH